MKYATCPNCGKRLCKGEAGTKIEIECSKCGEPMMLEIQMNEIIIKSQTAPRKIEQKQVN